MPVTDPVADMLARIRNAAAVKHDTVLVPASKIKVSIAKLLKEEGFIKEYQLLKGAPQKQLKIYLGYRDKKEPVISGLQRVSKPGLRIYAQRTEIPRVYGGLGIAILSTPKGIMTGKEAWRHKIGGEVICYIW